MEIIGITGQIGAGKSTVCANLRKRAGAFHNTEKEETAMWFFSDVYLIYLCSGLIILPCLLLAAWASALAAA